jgi:hypothetical protein
MNLLRYFGYHPLSLNEFPQTSVSPSTSVQRDRVPYQVWLARQMAPMPPPSQEERIAMQRQMTRMTPRVPNLQMERILPIPPSSPPPSPAAS